MISVNVSAEDMESHVLEQRRPKWGLNLTLQLRYLGQKVLLITFLNLITMKKKFSAATQSFLGFFLLLLFKVNVKQNNKHLLIITSLL